jgi:hypothetical protein
VIAKDSPGLLVSMRYIQSSNRRETRNDKKENQIFLIYKEIQSGAAAKEGLPNIWGNAQIFPHI